MNTQALFITLTALMAALALACVVPPLLRRRAAGMGNAAATPQPRLALLLAVCLPAAAAALYFQVGRPDVLTMPPALLQAAATPSDHGPSEQDIPAMVERLAERLRSEPENIDGWHMLARSYSAMNRYADAAQAYAHLAKLLPQDAGVLADYADALATAREGKLAGEPERLVERALAIDPQQPKALALAGSAAFAKGDYARAEQRWSAVLAQLDGDSDFARSTQAGIAEARARQGAPAPAPALAGTIRLAPGTPAPAPGQVLFVYARAADGAPMPLAAVRRNAGALPRSFALDDSHGLTPGTRLADVPKLIVGARISASGSATAQPGDLEGETGPVVPGSGGLVIELAPRKAPRQE
ncbi:MAG: hypothetical protein K0R43_3629 [Pseudoduganella sp.]|nr:hypothetical protein [Pseudoduganella sp.]